MARKYTRKATRKSAKKTARKTKVARARPAAKQQYFDEQFTLLSQTLDQIQARLDNQDEMILQLLAHFHLEQQSEQNGDNDGDDGDNGDEDEERPPDQHAAA